MYPIIEIRKLSPVERAVVETLLRKGPGGQRDLMMHMRDAPSQATMSRIMSGLIDKGLLEKTGETRGSRFSLTPDAKRLATDPRMRERVAYDPSRIEGYIPNVSRWLPDAACERMRSAIERAGGQKLDAATYNRAIAERFLIDLSWASSNLEGNTYDQLSTEILIKYGQSASGRDRLETAMILNHKAAISDMLEGFDRSFPDIFSVQRRHVLMMRDLMDPADLGAIRRNAAQISATSYRPSSDRFLLTSGLSDLLTKAGQVDDPMESSFFLLSGISYLQAFGDGNKRMGRLLSSEPLLRSGLPPLSFIGIDKTPYILGLIDFYETGSTDLLSDAIADSYEITAPGYIESVTVQRVPHSLELRERSRIASVLGSVFRDGIGDEDISEAVVEVFYDMSDYDREKIIEIISETARNTSPASAFLYQANPEDVLAWQSRLCRQCGRHSCSCGDDFSPEIP